LSQARDRINEAQSDVRENILSLRTTLGESEGLLPALAQYLEEFGVLANIPVRLANELADDPRLSPLAETQLVRIIQEALANVRKHAHAQQVVVRLVRLDGHLGVTIEDDGTGMREEVGRYHFGLETMRERAASVGGDLTIHSEPGYGTRVEVQLPLIERG
jgi:signal transduction histidine kinase